MFVDFAKFQNAAVSLFAAIFIAGVCVSAAVGPVVPILA